MSLSNPVPSFILVRRSPNEWANRSRRGKGCRTTRTCCALVELRSLMVSQPTTLEISKTPRSRIPHRLHLLKQAIVPKLFSHNVTHSCANRQRITNVSFVELKHCLDPTKIARNGERQSILMQIGAISLNLPNFGPGWIHYPATAKELRACVDKSKPKPPVSTIETSVSSSESLGSA